MTYTRRPNLKTVRMYVVIIPISRMRRQMLEDGQQLAETWDQPMAIQDQVLQPPLTVFWESEIPSEVNPPFLGPGGLCCTQTSSGGEAGRRTLRSFRSTWPCVNKHWKQWKPGVRVVGAPALAMPPAGCNISVVSLWTRKCPTVWGRACPHDFVGPTFCHLPVGMPGTDNVWLVFGTKEKKPLRRHRKQMQLEREKKAFSTVILGHLQLFLY